MSTVTIAHKAYLKALLHASKYPASAVNGVLLASANDRHLIVDAVPFFHFWNTLTPMLEVAMSQVELHCQKNDLVLAGYYEANERMTDHKLSTAGQKIASQILHINPGAFVVVVDNSKVASDENALVPYAFKDSAWRVNKQGFGEQFRLENPATPSLVAKAIESREYEKLADFDSHLENVSADWITNRAIAV
ncbi:hypothetical protein DFQ27_004748 [Actinomortierella ambigua]|uniref:MPN domain-containing protein n=1 Tax=Actinomortierella ambigua TaxID=1343610 RepID=A0A9P6Q2S2_9FUNG|nr:hypothetical protein DFQ26_008059 [Actinomortierella ambigua]KAG0258239.1 hypothetical protein DFQ27_004748 [Actinomortierella ambigua]